MSWRDHEPRAGVDIVGSTWIECTCGWDSTQSDLGWVEHIEAEPFTDENPLVTDRPIRGDVGAITGPPILGTADRINAGQAKLPKDATDYDEAMAVLSMEVPPHPYRPMAGSVQCMVCSGWGQEGGQHIADADADG